MRTTESGSRMDLPVLLQEDKLKHHYKACWFLQMGLVTFLMAGEFSQLVHVVPKGKCSDKLIEDM